VIVAVGADAVGDARDLARAVGSRAPGDRVELKILRAGKMQPLAAVLGAMPKDAGRVFGRWPGLGKFPPGGVEPEFWERMRRFREKMPRGGADMELFGPDIEGRINDAMNGIGIAVGPDAFGGGAGAEEVIVNLSHKVRITGVGKDRRVTVWDRKTGKAIAKDLPYDRLRELPEEVQDLVKDGKGAKGRATIRIMKRVDRDKEKPALPEDEDDI
jgi:hypothetical protein